MKEEDTLTAECLRQYCNGGQVEIDCMKTPGIFRAGISNIELKEGRLHIVTAWYAQGEPYPIVSEYCSIPAHDLSFLLADSRVSTVGSRLRIELPRHDIGLVFCPAGDTDNLKPEDLMVSQGM